VKVTIPTPLRSYTSQERVVEADGATVGEMLADLDRRFPGIRFRMLNEQDVLRPHVRVFVNAKQVKDLGTPLAPDDEIDILQALSGG
jgi:molybdopterin converting factor small subunit